MQHAVAVALRAARHVSAGRDGVVLVRHAGVQVQFDRHAGPAAVQVQHPPPCKYSTAALLSLEGWRYHLASSVAPSGVTTPWSEMSTLPATGCAWLLKYFTA